MNSMRPIPKILVLPMFALFSVSGWTDEANEVASFNTAFTAYKQYAEAGDYQNAVLSAEQSYEIGKKIFDDSSPNLPALAFNYGAMLAMADLNEQARPVLEEALDLYETIYGDDSVELIPVLMQLGYVSADATNSKPQRRQFDRALKLSRTHHGEESEEYGGLLLQAGQDILNKSVPRGSSKYLNEAYEVLGNVSGPLHPATGVAAFNLGRLEMSRGNYKSAQPLLLAALQSFEDPDRPDSHVEMTTHAFLITAYQETDQSEKANQHCVAIGRMTPQDSDQDYLPLYRRAPRYPQTPLMNGWEGYVDIQFTVDDVGIIREPTVVYATRNGFVDAALDAVSNFRYAPRFVDGRAVATEGVKTRISFQIE